MESLRNETPPFRCPSSQHSGILAMPLVMIIEMIVGLPTNMVALWIFCCRMKFWKPHNLFLFNLVLADFFLLISVPFRIDVHFRDENWLYGHVWCRINLFLLAVNRSASIGFMTVVALDRYFKLVHPHHRINRMTSVQARCLTGLIWLAVIALRIPLLTINLLYQEGNRTLCRSFSSYDEIPLPVKVNQAAFTIEFFLPWFVLLFCSGRIACMLHQRGLDRQKNVKRAIRTVCVINLVFTICFLPSIFTGMVALCIRKLYPTDCSLYNKWTSIFIWSFAFTYLNSSLDPFIYTFSSSKFREALKRSFTCFWCWERNAAPPDSNAVEQSSSEP